MQLKKVENISVFIAILIHVSGVVGILFTPYRDWFVAFTPLNLLLMFVLLVINQPKRTQWFWLLVAICFVTGMLVEIIGVQTGWLFGSYAYGHILGPKLAGVPWLIGLYWFVVVYGSGNLMYLLMQKLFRPFSEVPGFFEKKSTLFVIVFDGAILATCFDFLMEPAAIKLGFWHWDGLVVPWFNYLCWFIISLLLLVVLVKLPFQKNNYFAVHLLLIQLLFFLALSFYL